MAAPAAAEAPGRSARSTARQRRKPVRGLTITIPPQPPEDSIDSRGSSEQGPVYIRVHKVMLKCVEPFGEWSDDMTAVAGIVPIYATCIARPHLNGISCFTGAADADRGAAGGGHKCVGRPGDDSAAGQPAELHQQRWAAVGRRGCQQPAEPRHQQPAESRLPEDDELLPAHWTDAPATRCAVAQGVIKDCGEACRSHAQPAARSNVTLTRCGTPAGLRSSARLAGQSASELNDRHRQLLHKLLWRGKVSCSPAPRHKEASSSAPVVHASRVAPRSRPAQGGGVRHTISDQLKPYMTAYDEGTPSMLLYLRTISTGTAGSESRLRQRVSPNAGAGPAPPSPDQQHCDVVLSPVFSQEEIDMLLDVGVNRHLNSWFVHGCVR